MDIYFQETGSVSRRRILQLCLGAVGAAFTAPKLVKPVRATTTSSLSSIYSQFDQQALNAFIAQKGTWDQNTGALGRNIAGALIGTYTDSGSGVKTNVYNSFVPDTGALSGNNIAFAPAAGDLLACYNDPTSGQLTYLYFQVPPPSPQTPYGLLDTYDGFYNVGNQRHSAPFIMDAVLHQDLTSLDTGLKVIEFAFSHQLLDGSFVGLAVPGLLPAEARVDIAGDVSWFLQDVGCSLLLLKSSSWFARSVPASYRNRASALSTAITKSLDFVLGEQSDLLANNYNAPNRLLFIAAGLYLTGLYLRRSDALAAARTFVDPANVQPYTTSVDGFEINTYKAGALFWQSSTVATALDHEYPRTHYYEEILPINPDPDALSAAKAQTAAFEARIESEPTGYIAENFGYDASYHGISMRLLTWIYEAMSTNDPLKTQIKQALDQGATWLLGRMITEGDDTGRIDTTNCTRVVDAGDTSDCPWLTGGSGETYLGASKNYDWRETVLALNYYGVKFGDSNVLSMVSKIEEYYS